MRRQPALTFAGALKILGKHEPGIVDKLDKALGGIILGAGVAAVLAGSTVAAPAALMAAIWGWVDQKNEAIGLLRSLTNRLSNRITNTKGLDRRDLVLAAHSTIVAASFLEVLEERLGKSAVNDLALRKQQTIRWASHMSARDYLERLYQSEIPVPSPSCGFEGNTERLVAWAREARDTFANSVVGLSGPEPISLTNLTPGFLNRYRSRYVQLAEVAPEFQIWAMLTEHSATQHAVMSLGHNVRTALKTQGDTLARVEALLNLVASRGDTPSGHRHALRRANFGVLGEPLVSGKAESYDTDVTFPTVQQAFLLPHYRVASTRRDARPADESWWEDRPVDRDLELMLAAYLTSGDATRLPMLLLGHPGAGKSMLTKVLAAARLPSSDYTVVRVPLRDVGAGAPIIDQIQEALHTATNGRVDWHRLSDESADTVMLVLLDGLDELLQAATFDRSSYLQEVMEFQRIEGEHGRPIAAIVTSRTVVADRVDIPPDTTIVKLEEFDDDQIAAWLETWRTTNAGAIAAGRVRELTVAQVWHQIDLARQPLLLMMLALYAADPTSPALDSGLSRSALYERIFDNFARREVQKRAPNPLRGTALDRAVGDQIFRLSVAALAMFNRGTQQLREADLRSDLAALQGNEVSESAGERVLGEFFFVHTPEAKLRSRERSYEFLHATFGEYLVARHVMGELTDIAPASRIQDEMLFALLSHQPWAARPSIVDFAVEIFEKLPDGDQDNIRRALDELIRSYRHRRRSATLDSYRPVPLDFVRQLAVYSANLFTLAISFAGPPRELNLVGVLGDTDEDARHNWRSMLSLWRSGLDQDGWRAMLFSLAPNSGLVMTRRDRSEISTAHGLDEFWSATLAGDAGQANRVRHGMALQDSHWITVDDNWAETMHTWINPAILYGIMADLDFGDFPENLTEYEADRLRIMLSRLLRIRAGSLREDHIQKILNILDKIRAVDVISVLMVAYHHPQILLHAKQWHDPVLYAGHRAELRLIMDEATFRLGQSHHEEWRRLRSKLVGNEPPATKDLAAHLLKTLTSAP